MLLATEVTEAKRRVFLVNFITSQGTAERQEMINILPMNHEINGHNKHSFFIRTLLKRLRPAMAQNLEYSKGRG